MARYRNTRTGQEISWDDKKGKLTPYWVLVEGNTRPEHEDAAESHTEAPEGTEETEEAPEEQNNTFNSWRELVAGADRSQPAFRKAKDGSYQEYSFNGSQWQKAEDAVDYEEAQLVPQEIDWGQ